MNSAEWVWMPPVPDGSNLIVLVVAAAASAIFILLTIVANATTGTTFGVLIVLFRTCAGLGDGFVQTAGLAYCIRTVVRLPVPWLVARTSLGAKY